MTIDLIAAAQAAHAETLAAQAIDKAEAAAAQDEEHASFLRAVSQYATKVLGPTAEDLSWANASLGSEGELPYAATADIAPGRTHDLHLNARFSAAQGTFSLALVRTCRSCSDQLTDQIESLPDLGKFLNEDQAHDQDPEATDGQEPGPLTALERMESYATRVARLARRLLTEHPDAGLTIRYAALSGHEHSEGRAELQLNATSVDAVRQVAAALGAEVTTRNSSSMRSMVLQHADAEATVDGITVELSGYNPLSDDEAAAWLAQQNQPTTEASDGGDV